MAKFDPSLTRGSDDPRQVHLGMMLDRYVAEIEHIIGRLAKGEFAEVAQLPKLKRELMSVAKQLRDAEIEIDEHERNKSRRSNAAGGPIDMDAARDAIRSRLDCLRDARDAGGVSEGTE
ncbi:MAG: hypothetical protein AAGI10_01900 [Pseudomonadota bacterium]